MTAPMTTTSQYNPTQAVFERVVARPVAPPDTQHGRLVHVLWVAPQQGDRLVQLYVNGRLAEVSRSSADRAAWLLLDPSSHHEIELLAVDRADATLDLSARLAGHPVPTMPAVDLALLRAYEQPIDAAVSIGLESAGIDDRTPLFASDSPRGGFGAVFGEGGFGYDAATGPGLGLGELGYGPLGIDGQALRWRHTALPAGEHAFTVALRTDAGTVSEQTLTRSVARLPDPPTNLALDADLTLTWT